MSDKSVFQPLVMAVLSPSPHLTGGVMGRRTTKAVVIIPNKESE